jgi:hypothetical protein
VDPYGIQAQGSRTESLGFPRVTFGIIVLNGEPFTRYCLRSLYPYAHEIIVVEGGHEDTRSVATPDGHSIDGTVEVLQRFCKEEDPEHKVTVVMRDGFWPKQDELGRNRTPQSRAYAELATGDYLWQVDVDEFYRARDMECVLGMLADDDSITAMSFRTRTFWGDPSYAVDCWHSRRGGDQYHRLFKWGPGYRYLTHEPPTVSDARGRDLRQQHWVDARASAARGVYLFHYSLLFPWQVRQKVLIYRDEKPRACAEIVTWAEKSYFALGNPYRVHNHYDSPSWLQRYGGDHPQQVRVMMADIRAGRVRAQVRQNEDVERLLGSWWYPVGRRCLMIGDYLDRAMLIARHPRSWWRRRAQTRRKASAP